MISKKPPVIRRLFGVSQKFACGDLLRQELSECLRASA